MNTNPVKINVTSFDLSKAMTFSKILTKVKLSPTARLVLRCLVDFWNPAKGLVYPGQKTISECTGASIRSVNSAIEELRKSGLILTTGEAGERLKYYFTAKFFDITGIAQGYAKIADPTYAKIAQHEQKKLKQINNNNNSFENKNNHKVYSKPQEAPKYKSASQTLQTIEKDKKQACSPLDFSKEDQIKYYNNLPAFLKINSIFAKEIKKRWNLE